MSERVILCIDDESIVLDALKEQIQKEFVSEFLVETAESGDEAIEIFEELTGEGDEIPVVIADFIMPGMKGDALLEKIHTMDPRSKTILLTGQASIEGIGNAINKADLYRFIAKPWEKDDLVLTIKEAIKSYEQEGTILEQNKELTELNINLENKVEQRTQELRELNATKDKFFSIIAHDLKNPFNTLLGFTELMLDSLEDFDYEKIREFISIIADTSKHSYALLENLLEWSRSQTGRIQMKPETIDLYKLVEENIDFLLNQAGNKKIKLVNGVASPAHVHADANMLNTVVRNLISNAIKYTGEGGSITVSAIEKDGMVETSVADTGMGIKPENLEKLFRIDVNFSTKGTANEIGTGLGLILCKEFITRNEGKIWVESELGKGSTFKFTLPVGK